MSCRLAPYTENPYSLEKTNKENKDKKEKDKRLKTRPQSGKVRPLQPLRYGSKANIGPVINIADHVGGNSVQRLRSSLSKAGLSMNIAQNGQQLYPLPVSQARSRPASGLPPPRSGKRSRPASSNPGRAPDGRRPDWTGDYGLLAKQKTEDKAPHLFDIIDHQMGIKNESEHIQDEDLGI